MKQDIIIGVDIAKNVFQVHAAKLAGDILFRKKLTRTQFTRFIAEQDPCLFAMEACGTSHYWAREIKSNGHEVRLLPPIYVKPFVKRQKNDAADAEAIVAAACRPGMSFVQPKTADTQARTMMMRFRDQLIEQRTATVNALRGHLAEFGIIAPTGIKNIEVLRKKLEDEASLPALALEMAYLHLERISSLTSDLDALSAKIKDQNKQSSIAKQLQTMPGIGPISAAIIETFSPDMGSFKCGRDFAAWLGLIPRQHSTGGKSRLGRTTKMGQKDIRQTLIIGAMSCIASHSRRGTTSNLWLLDKLERKPKMLAAIALANKMARQIWAMITKGETYVMPKAN